MYQLIPLHDHFSSKVRVVDSSVIWRTTYVERAVLTHSGHRVMRVRPRFLLAIEHIVCDPGKRSGKPYIAGTGMAEAHTSKRINAHLRNMLPTVPACCMVRSFPYTRVKEYHTE